MAVLGARLVMHRALRRGPATILGVLLAASLIAAAGVAAQSVDWVRNPATGHWYGVVEDMTWAEGEAYAVSIGGHLATINDEAEDRWISATFPGQVGIGFNDLVQEGAWVWASGEPVTYTNWVGTEPNDGGGGTETEDIVVINSDMSPSLGPSWKATADMAFGRFHHTATLLADGRVLVVGGTPGEIDGERDKDPLASAELYDPRTGTWSPTASMKTPRASHAAVLLDDGRVLVVGGVRTEDPDYTPLASAELYDPSTGQWAAMGSLHNPAGRPTATLLQTGEVLVVGADQGEVRYNSEIHDPATGKWRAGGGPTTVRAGGHTATLLADGRVLVVGGSAGGEAPVAKADIYDPATGKWTATGSMTTKRSRHTATLLSDGTVLVTGGQIADMEPLVSAEVYDPKTGKWTRTNDLTIRRVDATATLLGDGRVLVAGGWSGDIIHSSEIYDPATGRWGLGLRMTDYRLGHTATLLADGRRVLVAGGGQGAAFAERGAELFDPGILGVSGWADQPTRAAGDPYGLLIEVVSPIAPLASPTATPSPAPSASPSASAGVVVVVIGAGGSGVGYREPGTLVPGITRYIPTPGDLLIDPSVIWTNLLLAGLVMVMLIIATELLNRSLGELEPVLSGRLAIVRRVQRGLARLNATTVQRLAARRSRLVDVARLAGIAAFYGIAFSFLDPTWNPLSVQGLWLVLMMALAVGVVGLGGDIAAWAVGRRWGVVGDLQFRAGSLLAAVGSTLVSRALVLVPGVMIGSPEVIEVHPDRVDQRRLGIIAAVGMGTVLLIGLAAWGLTLGTAALRGTAGGLDPALGGAQAFLLLVFAFAVQNAFVQLLSIRQSGGLALRRTHPFWWGAALLLVSFVFWQTLVNPGGDLASALRTRNALAFLAAAGVVLFVSLAVWVGTRLAWLRVAEPVESGAVRAIDLQRTFRHGPKALAEKAGIDTGRAKALRWHLGIEADPACRHDFVFGRIKVPMYSDRALERMRQAIGGGANLSDVRRAYEAAGRP